MPVNYGAGFAGGSGGYLYYTPSSTLNWSAGDGAVSLYCSITTKAFNQSFVAIRFQDGTRTMRVYYNTANDRFEIQASANGSTIVTATANNFGSPSINTKYHIVAGRSGGNIFIRVNMGTPNTAAFAGTFHEGGLEFTVGGEQYYSSGGTRVNGTIDEVYWWKGYVPTEDELNVLYSSGAFTYYNSYLLAGGTIPLAMWRLEEATASNRLDSTGNGHTLLRNNTGGAVIQATGLVDLIPPRFSVLADYDFGTHTEGDTIPNYAPSIGNEGDTVLNNATVSVPSWLYVFEGPTPDPIDLDPLFTAIWDIRVQPDIAPGVYEGDITYTADEDTEVVHATLTVLPAPGGGSGASATVKPALRVGTRLGV